MKFTKLAMTTVFYLLAGGLLALPGLAQDAKIQEVALETPFVLAQGETARIATEGIEVTLRSVSDDSGCFAPDDCSIMLFNGTLAVRQGEQRRMMEVHASLHEGNVLSLELDGYDLRMTAIKKAAHGRLEATFEVVPKPEKKPDE